MARYFTHYWKHATYLRHRQPGELLSHTAGNQFTHAGICEGDHVYVVTNEHGHLIVVGSLVVGGIVSKSRAADHFGVPPSSMWDAEEHLIAEPGSVTPINTELVVSAQDARALRFLSGGREKSLIFQTFDHLDNQTLRGVRELTLESAFILDSYLAAPISKPEANAGIVQRLQALRGNTSKDIESTARREQALLRAFLFGEKASAACAICCREFPTEFLVCAHIKRRERCSEQERVDPNIVMAACKFGCDELYEKGYVFVDDGGMNRINAGLSATQAVAAYLDRLQGIRCLAWNPHTAPFFEAHREAIKTIG